MPPVPQEPVQPEASASDRVVVSGMSGLYPNSRNVAELSDILYNKKQRKPRPKLEKMKRIEKKKTKRETLQVSRATIDLTSDAMTDVSSDGDSGDENLSPIRRVHRLLHSTAKPKARRKKKMPLGV